MIRRILVALDGSDFGRSAGKYAAHLGVRARAGVDALTVIDVRPLEGPMLRDFTAHLGLEPFETYTQALREVMQSRANDVLEQFRHDASDAGLGEDCISPVSEVGMIADTICRHAAAVDVAIVGQHGERPGVTGGLLGSTSEQIVRRTSRHVMVCPAQFRPIEHPMVTYDSSLSGETALHAAADFAGQMGTDLTVLVVVDAEQTAEVARDVSARAEAYLAHAKAPHCVETVEGHAEERIVAYAEENGRDLIVMGAFGQSRIRELIVGSTTASVMRTSPVPVMLVRK